MAKPSSTSHRTIHAAASRAARRTLQSPPMARPLEAAESEPGLALVAIANAAWQSEFLGAADRSPGRCSGKPPCHRPGAAPSDADAIDLLRCRVIWRLVSELFAAACERELPEAMAHRRPRCHMRQIAMYLSHVVLSVPYRSIATAFGRDRTTVRHACAVVEDRRDDLSYDRFVERCERCINAVFLPFGHPHAER